MRFVLGIPFVNRPDLLKVAVKSVEPLWPDCFVLDNSDEGEVFYRPNDWPVEVRRFEGLAPLSFSQSMNYMIHAARCSQCDLLLFMHNDAQALMGTPERLLLRVREATEAGRNWGIAFTNYDTLAALRLAAADQVGPWDTNLPQYFADNDYYRRLRLAGFELLDTGLPVTHHSNASSTLKSDPKRALIHGITFRLYEEYYRRKWGGSPPNETFLLPFGSDMFASKVRRLSG